MNLLFGVEMASLVNRGRQGAELRQRFICAARQRAGGRRRGRQAGPKAGSGERSGSEGSHWHTCPGVCGGQRRAQSPNGASRIRKAPVETLVSQAPKLIGRNRCQTCRAFAEWHGRGREKRRRHLGGGPRSLRLSARARRLGAQPESS